MEGRKVTRRQTPALITSNYIIERITRLPGVRAVGFAELFLPSPEGWHDAVSAATSDWSRASDVMADTALAPPHSLRPMSKHLHSGHGFDTYRDIPVHRLP